MINLRRRNNPLISEINIIPFTDIILVILVVFIVTTPLLIMSAIRVNLPQAAPSMTVQTEQNVRIAITKEGQIYADESPMNGLMGLEPYLLARFQDTPLPVRLDADKDAPYGIVAQVLALAQKLKATKLELVTRQEQ